MGHTTGVTIRLHNHKHTHLSMVNTGSCYVMNHPKNLVISNKQKLKDLRDSHFIVKLQHAWLNTTKCFQ